ncbi:hypothetical protein [Fischerella sp. PCC 9605]|nr:hypothetical protein [Fischerella sp. PCC 9605]
MTTIDGGYMRRPEAVERPPRLILLHPRPIRPTYIPVVTTYINK